MLTRLYQYNGDKPVRVPEDPSEPVVLEIARPSRRTRIAASNEETARLLDEHPDFEFLEEIAKDEKPGERPPEPHEYAVMRKQYREEARARAIEAERAAEPVAEEAEAK